MSILAIPILGEARHPSPVAYHVPDNVYIPAEVGWVNGAPPAEPLLFERAGPRAKLFFDPKQTRAGIVTCGGLCPGLNNVIRSLFLELYYGYGVKEVLGFYDGYRGLDPARCKPPVVLTPEFVEDIHKQGGTVLNTSRGPVDTGVAVDNLIERKVDILFTIGGDGTLRGGRDLYLEAKRRGYALSVVGIPKTIDNDVPYVARTFGYFTAVEEASQVIRRAHMEAHSVENGISLVKLMGRHSGFIAAGATIASQDVNFCLIPEVPFALEGPDGFLEALKKRILKRKHAVIVIAEGTGQDLLGNEGDERDASGNVKLKDIGSFLREKIQAFFKAEQIPVVLRYIDPSYIIRSCPADAEDAVLCDLLARNAAHAAMAGKTGMAVGLVNDHYVHVPIEMLATHRKRVDPDGEEWRAVLAATGQPARMGSPAR
ncbi:MAG TPA: ATP-dependent 6-phosphofructokinase [Verrucomicrobia bacterium]|nr:ATP-dependent 6-phosphofructokinase [Verrucomicrobiota bacterium]